jgi:hypothetical protein
MYTDQDISNLVDRVQQLERQPILPKQVPLPQYGILSKNFLTRAFSVWGLYFVANLLISIVIICIAVLLGLVLGISSTDWLTQAIGLFPTS